MNEELREQIALFRFGVISALVNRKGLSWGEREEMVKQIISKLGLPRFSGQDFGKMVREGRRPNGGEAKQIHTGVQGGGGEIA